VALNKIIIVISNNEQLLEEFISFIYPTLLKEWRPDELFIKHTTSNNLSTLLEQENISNYLVVEVTDNLFKPKLNFIKQELKKNDSEDIGVYSMINGATEVLLGSALHAIRFPSTGQIMVGLQNFLLILFTKELNGRGLFWITTISAGMKSFSPAGNRIKPMLYIFLQGNCYLLPIKILGKNFLAVLLGSVLIQMSALIFKFFSAYITFGAAIFVAYLNGANLLLSNLNFPNVNIWTLFTALSILKIIIGIVLATVTYHLNFKSLLLKWRGIVENHLPKDIKIETYTWKESVKGAFRDLSLKRFLLPFALTTFIIYFFSNLTTTQLILVTTRAAIISWMTFVLSRRINYNAVIHYLRKNGFSHIAGPMEKALKSVASFRKK